MDIHFFRKEKEDTQKKKSKTPKRKKKEMDTHFFQLRNLWMSFFPFTWIVQDPPHWEVNARREKEDTQKKKNTIPKQNQDKTSSKITPHKHDQ